MQEYLTNWAPAILEQGEVWRLLSYGLLHLWFPHLLFNMLFLVYTGYHLERAIGRANLLRATVLARDGDRVTLDIAGRRHQAAATGAASSLGKTIQAVVRPEALAIDAAGAGASLPGTVVTRTYLGEKVEYLIAAGDETLQVVQLGPAEARRFPSGTSVGIRLPATGIHLIEEPEA